jgi:hypothetical protein
MISPCFDMTPDYVMNDEINCVYRDVITLMEENICPDQLYRIKQNIIESDIYTNTVICLIIKHKYDVNPDIMDLLISYCSPYKGTLTTKITIVELIISGPSYIFNIYIHRHLHNEITALCLYRLYKNKFTADNIRTIQHKFNYLTKIDE